ncbi:4Fe-4S dicluster domain-containing protein [Geotalea sp. SG265]|uniref:4Fe-4S dicluster domain-containing protein n=1 Tax=Geotalea sp. SG265 TaxID=2922867 RepID=UPI001FAF9AEE|nr:4Fe-4S dicluster domain-containing protein [Geotalea sp. SG265]
MAATGFFTDTSVCIGCKACEVACKQWNQLPADGNFFSGRSYDNTLHLESTTWRHVAFVEQNRNLSGQTTAQPFSWLFLSDVCKHCRRAGCLEACPTGAIVRTEFESVYVQPDVCNGCGYCVVACPFGVINRRNDDGRAWKCTLCYDRQRQGMEPACAKTCPTDSIFFGPVDELRNRAEARLAELHRQGRQEAWLYGMTAEEQPGTEGLHAFFLLLHAPEAYNLPPSPVVPTKTIGTSWLAMGLAAAGMVAVTVAAVRHGGERT